MKIEGLHSWQVSIAEAKEIQERLAGYVSRVPEGALNPRFIAGLDIAVPSRGRQLATAAAVVLSYPELEIAEVKTVQGKLEFPYVPGLLSFRESPLTLAVCQVLSITPDLFLVDGAGLAHPRRMGFASHLGLFLDRPTIGCAKSLLWGNHDEPGAEPGSYAPILDKGEVIGTALRTKAHTKPVYVSIGHSIDLETAIYWVLKCCRGYRLPEPTRLAHLAAGGLKIKETARITVRPLI